jgi:hypothetical protein
MVKFLFIGLLALIFSNACAPSTTTQLSLDEVLAMANERRHEMIRLDVELAYQYIESYSPGEIKWSDAFGDGSTKAVLTAEEAISDTMSYFKMLRHYYSGYNHFGGDEVFEPMRDFIIDRLSQQEEWRTIEYRVLLNSQLSEIIHDNHFHIDYTLLGVDSFLYVGDEQYDRDERGFRRRGTRRYISKIVGHDINDVFRLNLGEDGSFFYAPVIIETDEPRGTYNLTFIMDNGSEEVISLSRIRPGARPFFLQELPSLEYINNIPVITLKNMGVPDCCGSDSDKERALPFLAFADELKEENVIIVDIRSNGGGFKYLTQLWLYLLIGEKVPNNHITVGTLGTFTETPNEMQNEITHDLCDLYCELNEQLLLENFVPFGDYHIVSYPASRIVANDKLIILLVDRFTASAGEVFADHILSMENTLIIGQNTNGMILTGGVSTDKPFSLPHSGLYYQMGALYHIFDPAYFQEGIGIAPDVWVTGDALAAALAMLNNL